MSPSIQWAAELANVREVSLRGTADLAFWTDRLKPEDLLPAERTVVTDSGNFMGYPAMFLEVPDENGFVFTQAFQSVGLGLATALGAAIARPDRLTG